MISRIRLLLILQPPMGCALLCQNSTISQPAPVTPSPCPRQMGLQLRRRPKADLSSRRSSSGRVARLSRNVRQPDHVLANSFAGHKAEPWPGADEEWLAMTKNDGMDVESILINQIKVGQAPCQVWSGYVDLPIQLGF